MEKADILIIGAGPGGATAALQLNKLGLPCVLVDKAIFPRDKVCGDAIGTKGIHVLNQINPEIINSFHKSNKPKNIHGIRFMVAHNDTIVDIPLAQSPEAFKLNPSYVATRVDFDNHLVEAVKKCPLIDFREAINIAHIEKTATGFVVSDKTGVFKMDCKMLLVANGAQSQFARKYAGIEKELPHYAGGIRAYYNNVADLHQDGYLEIHYLKEYVPGYFWIFPLPNNRANVGMGMRSDYLSKDKLNLRKTLQTIVAEHPVLKKRFQGATLEDKIVGFPLPFGSKMYSISGDNFMLIGDAAHLIDPLTGEGISNAICSGSFAAEQAKKCFTKKDFSADFLKAYDLKIAKILGEEMKSSYQVQRFLSLKWLMPLFVDVLLKSKKLRAMASQMYVNVPFRKNLTKPFFWLKLIFQKEFIPK